MSNFKEQLAVTSSSPQESQWGGGDYEENISQQQKLHAAYEGKLEEEALVNEDNLCEKIGCANYFSSKEYTLKPGDGFEKILTKILWDTVLKTLGQSELSMIAKQFDEIYKQIVPGGLHPNDVVIFRDGVFAIRNAAGKMLFSRQLPIAPNQLIVQTSTKNPHINLVPPRYTAAAESTAVARNRITSRSLPIKTPTARETTSENIDIALSWASLVISLGGMVWATALAPGAVAVGGVTVATVSTAIFVASIGKCLIDGAVEAYAIHEASSDTTQTKNTLQTIWKVGLKVASSKFWWPLIKKISWWMIKESSSKFFSKLMKWAVELVNYISSSAAFSQATQPL